MEMQSQHGKFTIDTQENLCVKNREKQAKTKNEQKGQLLMVQMSTRPKFISQEKKLKTGKKTGENKKLNC